MLVAQADPAAARTGDATAGKAGAEKPAAVEEEEKLEHPFKNRSRAPSLDGGVAWINTSGPIDIKDLKGKFVVLDFWTYCCINCIHVLPELKKLEKAYPNEVVVIGVHSAKFETEEDSKNISEAVQRYEIEHPVVNDSDHKIWNKYGVNSWPSLRIIDPEGNWVVNHSGEIEFEVLDKAIKSWLPYYRQNKLLDERPLHFDLEVNKAAKTPLRFPGKLLADEKSGRLFISDSNHNRIVIAGLDGELIDVVGSGAIGAANGPYATAQFDHPQGMVLHGDTLYVADTENHLLRKVDLKAKTVTTIAGLGRQGRNAWPGLDEDAPAARFPLRPRRFVGPPKTTALNSPWDLAIHGSDLYIAMAGPHQIWKMPLDESEIGPYAGNGREDIVDGPLLPREPYELGYSSFAQPSGLASDGKWLYVADSEGSSIRAVPFDPAGKVKTIVGTAGLPSARLFTFGDVDGRGDEVRLQHALGVVYHEGKLYVSDTYNNKIKVIDPDEASSTTLAGDGKPGTSDSPARFDEPTGISYAAGKLYVADTNNHLIRTIDLKAKNGVATLEIKGLAPPAKAGPKSAAKPSFAGATQVAVESATLKPVDGKIELQAELKLPAGYKINTQAPMRYYVEPVAKTGPVDRAALEKLSPIAKPSATFSVSLPVSSDEGEDLVKVSLNYYFCEEGDRGLCRSGSVSWTVPVKLAGDGAASAKLEHTVKNP